MSDLAALSIYFGAWIPVRILMRRWVRPLELMKRGRRGLAFGIVVLDRSIFLGLVWAVVPGDARASLALASAGRFGWWGAAGLGVAAFVCAMALAGVVPGLVVQRLPNGNIVKEAFRSGAKKGEALRAFAPHSVVEFAAMMLAIVVFAAGIGEEVIYRGFLQGRFAAFLPLPIAALVQTALFGADHYVSQGLRGAIEAFLAGVALTGVFLFTGSLVAPIFAHTLQDAVGVTALFLAARSGKLEFLIAQSAGVAGAPSTPPLPPAGGGTGGGSLC